MNWSKTALGGAVSIAMALFPIAAAAQDGADTWSPDSGLDDAFGAGRHGALTVGPRLTVTFGGGTPAPRLGLVATYDADRPGTAFGRVDLAEAALTARGAPSVLALGQPVFGEGALYADGADGGDAPNRTGLYVVGGAVALGGLLYLGTQALEDGLETVGECVVTAVAITAGSDDEACR